MEERIEYIRSDTPRWQRVLLTFCGTFTVLFCIFYIVWITYNGQLVSKLSRCLIFILVIIGGVWFFFKILFYSITATDRGLETNIIIGRSRLFVWEDIIEVRRPRFGFPVNFTYVIAQNRDKILLLRNKKNYNELIQCIKDKAPNLTICNA